MIWVVAIFVATISILPVLYKTIRGAKRREAEAAFRAIVVEDANGGIEFKGVNAVVHGQHATFIGGEDDCRLRSDYLCKDPNGLGFEVVVEGSSAIGAATTKVKPLSETGFQYRLSRYPYRKH